MAEAVCDFYVIGNRTRMIMRRTVGDDLSIMTEAAEFLSQKLGCADYCAEALRVFLDQPMN